MPNVASLQLCKELYELSGGPGGNFFDTYAAYYLLDGVPVTRPKISIYEDLPGVHQLVLDAPAYDLGYLLRKLPQNVGRITLKHRETSGQWFVKWDDRKIEITSSSCDTPEDAACKLAIELFKQKLLRKDSDGSLHREGANK